MKMPKWMVNGFIILALLATGSCTLPQIGTREEIGSLPGSVKSF
jgi:hypothetical protein